jgi:glycosyltransferase involved in cell wall biosynthesis
MLTDLYPPFHSGGAGIYAYELSQALAERGHAVDVIHSLDCFHAKGGELRGGTWPNHPNVTVQTVQSRAGRFAAGLSLVTGHPVAKRRWLFDTLQRPYDVIHYHAMHHLGGPALFRLGQGIKIATLHTYWLICPTSFLLRNRREPCARKTCLTCTTLFYHRPPQLWRYWPSLRRAVQHLDALIAPSEFVRQRHAQALPDLPIECLPFWVMAPEANADATPPSDVRPFLTQDNKYFLYVGRLAENKGVQVLIRAFRGQRDRHLLIVGDGPYRESLHRLAGGDPYIHFLGARSRQELGAFYRHAAALVIPTLSHEVFGLVALEAMAHGIPLIVNAVGALTELAVSNEAGIIYRREDELRQILREFDERSEAAHRYAINGRRAATTRYTKDRHMMHYLEVVQSRCARSQHENTGRTQQRSDHSPPILGCRRDSGS